MTFLRLCQDKSVSGFLILPLKNKKSQKMQNLTAGHLYKEKSVLPDARRPRRRDQKHPVFQGISLCRPGVQRSFVGKEKENRIFLDMMFARTDAA